MLVYQRVSPVYRYFAGEHLMIIYGIPNRQAHDAHVCCSSPPDDTQWLDVPSGNDKITENGPVEIVDLSSYKMMIFQFVM